MNEDIDNHQHDHRYTEYPSKHILAHQNSPLREQGGDEKTSEDSRPLHSSQGDWPVAQIEPPVIQSSLGIT